MDIFSTEIGFHLLKLPVRMLCSVDAQMQRDTQEYLQRNFDSLSPLTLNCETPSMNSVNTHNSDHIITENI